MEKKFVLNEIAEITAKINALVLRMNRLYEFVDELDSTRVPTLHAADPVIQEALLQDISDWVYKKTDASRLDIQEFNRFLHERLGG